MLAIPPDLARLYETLLARKDVSSEQHPYYHKWLRYYLEFCHKYTLEPTEPRSFPPFDEKLRTRNQSDLHRSVAVLRMRNGTSPSPFRLALGDNRYAPVRPAPGHGSVTTSPRWGRSDGAMTLRRMA